MPWRLSPISLAEPCTTPTKFRNLTPYSIASTASYELNTAWDIIRSPDRLRGLIVRLKSGQEGTTRCAIGSLTIVVVFRTETHDLLTNGQSIPGSSGGDGDRSRWHLAFGVRTSCKDQLQGRRRSSYAGLPEIRTCDRGQVTNLLPQADDHSGCRH